MGGPCLAKYYKVKRMRIIITLNVVSQIQFCHVLPIIQYNKQFDKSFGMLVKGVRMGWKMSDFVRRMAENVTKEAQLAQRVQTNTLNQVYSIEHEAKIRQRVTIESSIDGLEKQLRKEIAQALRRSEDKVKALFAITFEKYAEHKKRPFDQKQIEEYNKLVKACEKVRWEYMVHRQACGFTIQNYQIVTSLYKLPPIITP